MRKLFWQVSSSLNGFMAGPEGELARTAGFTGPDFEAYALEMLRSIGGMVLGRRTYELFSGYWPTASGEDADLLNAMPKLVCSRTQPPLPWQNSRLAQGDLAQEITAWKTQPGGDLAVFGSANLASSLFQARLIDEVRLIMTPFLLDQGTPTFQAPLTPASLTLTRRECWGEGSVAQFYNVAYT